MFSLFLQTFLIFFASMRKLTSRRRIIMFIWSAYLLADWVAAFTVGLISDTKGETDAKQNNADLRTLWASFLLLHLDGPDTIASFSLEDNELWIRHFLRLILQVLAAIYILLKTLPKNKLWVSILLVLLAGTIKYAERSRALYLASLAHFGDSVYRKPNPGPEYERIQLMYSSVRGAHLPTSTLMVKGQYEGSQKIKYKDEKDLVNLNSTPLLRHAYTLFENFKGLIVGVLLSSQDRQSTREFFLDRTANDAFKIVGIELGLMYEVLQTKAFVLRNRIGYIFRFIAFCMVVVAFMLFSLVNKRGFHKYDLRVSYTLFIGALCLDTIAVLLHMFFDWAFIPQNDFWGKWPKLVSRIAKRMRWSESVSQSNIMNFCLKNYPKWINKLSTILGMEGFIENLKSMLFRSYRPVTQQPRKFFFAELRKKSLAFPDLKEAMSIFNRRGEHSVELFEKMKEGNNPQNGSGKSINELKRSLQDFEYAESLLFWHISTELCYSNNAAGGQFREICKLLSDYAFYLMDVQPTMVASVKGNWQMVFQDTCAEARRYFKRSSCSEHSQVCRKILEGETKIIPRALKGDLSKSVLFDACIIAKALQSLGEEQWKLMSQVWLEILCYAAMYCWGFIHAQQPSKGGELLTFIWLLMTHLGLGTRFEVGASAGKIQFIVGK